MNGSRTQTGGAGGSISGLNATLVCRDADTGDSTDRQRLEAGGVALLRYDGQGARLDLEMDDGVDMVDVALTILAPAPRQRVEITVSSGSETEPNAGASPLSQTQP